MRRACRSSRSRRHRDARTRPSRAWVPGTCAPALRLHPLARDDLRVERLDAVADGAPAVVLGAIARAVSEMHPQTMVAEKPRHRVRKRLVIARRDEQARLPIFDELLQPTDAGPDDRGAAGHRLERDETERFCERWHGAH